MSFLRDEKGNIQMVQAAIYLVVLLVVLYIGLTINQNVIDASSLESGDALYNASTDMNDVTTSAYGMAGIMPIVMIAVAILASLLGVVYLFR
ncbi:hypothetical protein KKE60_08875 [Patescibacteria group bacterium]|nr:hypothetical protein [Patescibacteria group bacterium]